jgi:hypothetical protein
MDIHRKSSNNIILNQLTDLYTSGIQIDDFCVGYVIDYDESFIVYQHVTKFGQEDGIHIVQIANLEKIETDTSYINSCQTLANTAQKSNAGLSLRAEQFNHLKSANKCFAFSLSLSGTASALGTLPLTFFTQTYPLKPFQP